MSSECSFDELPYTKPGPPFNAWGLYGPDDELGRLNLITEASVKRGRDEIKYGKVINLNLPLVQGNRHPHRGAPKHEVVHRGHVNDDIVSFNTQYSTQWDGLRHYPYQNYPEKGQFRFYNNQTMDDAKNSNVSRNGTQNYVRHPITSRAHLLDVPRYLKMNGMPPLSSYSPDTPITAAMLKGCAASEGITFAAGDILVVRSGFTETMMATSEEQQEVYAKRTHRYACGVDQGEEVLRFHWDNGIAAVVGDNPAYENHPTANSPSCHEVFLAGWGMPIGELFDLRELAATCEKLQKWSFFFTSMPLYVNGGIASPPNAQAIL